MKKNTREYGLQIRQKLYFFPAIDGLALDCVYVLGMYICWLRHGDPPGRTEAGGGWRESSTC